MPSLTKRELVTEVSERLGYTQSEVSDVLDAMLDGIVDVLARGDRIEIRNFGVFETKWHNARIGRNPRTGTRVPVARKRVVQFKPGKIIKERVSRGRDA